MLPLVIVLLLFRIKLCFTEVSGWVVDIAYSVIRNKVVCTLMRNDWTLSAFSRVRREAGGEGSAVSAYYLSDLITCHLQVKFNWAFAEQ